jgi:hypothetical protein
MESVLGEMLFGVFIAAQALAMIVLHQGKAVTDEPPSAETVRFVVPFRVAALRHNCCLARFLMSFAIGSNTNSAVSHRRISGPK